MRGEAFCGNTLWLLCLIITGITLLPAVSASFTEEWGEFQDDPSRRGFVSDNEGIFDELGTQSTISDGNAYQPLSVDLDNDNTSEIIAGDGTYLKLYVSDENSISLLDEINIGGSQAAMWSVVSDTDSNGFDEIITHNGSNISVIEYNGSSINIINSTEAPAPYSGLACYSGHCYYCMAGDNYTDFDVASGANTTYDAGNSIGFVSRTTNSPPIADIDRDSNMEMICPCDPDANSDEGLCVIDLDTHVLDTYFSGDGIIDNIQGSFGDVYSLFTYNLNGAGDTEIVACTATPSASGNLVHSKLFTYTAAGNAYFAAKDLVASVTASSIVCDCAAAIQDINDTGSYSICALSSQNSNDDSEDGTWIHCFAASDGTETYDSGTGGVAAIGGTPVYNIVMADMDGDDDFDILAGKYIFTLEGGFSNITVSDKFSSWLIADDVNNDNMLDICGQESGYTWCSYTNYTNELPVLNDSLDYSGYFNYMNPVCKNTNTTFMAQECGGLAECNYDNDVSVDQERLVTTCGVTGANYTYGAYDGSNPSVTCNFSSTGIKNVRIYIQDEANNETLTEYNPVNIPIQVIDGEEGVTCNILSTLVEEPAVGETASASETATNDAIEDTWGILFGTGSSSDKLKMIVGLCIVIGIIVTVAKAGGGVFGCAASAIIGLLIVTFIGLIPASILIIGIVSMVMLVVIGRFIFSSQGTGGG